MLLRQSREECKDQESIQSSTTHKPRKTYGKVTKHNKHNTQERIEVRPYPADDPKAARSR